jgi:transaldolase
MANQLEQLRRFTTIVADTGDIASIKKYQPTDATTNPSLMYKAAQMPEYRELIEEAAAYSKQKAQSSSDRLPLLLDRLTVNIGTEILKIVSGRVSTEVDARLSFDTEQSLARAHRLIDLFAEKGIERERVLIKLASTWRGIETARQLEKEGIHCNMTLLFTPMQAVAAAEAGATLISPFVGRILDWHKKAEGVTGYPPAEDPGVRSVSSIYTYYKKFGYDTQVMGASFRNKEEVLELAGCDLLTISPNLLKELESSEEHVERKLDPKQAMEADVGRLEVDESKFRWSMNENPMATEKLAEGIRNFAVDTRKLEELVQREMALN